MTLAEFIAEWHNDSPTLTVHTSGSTGKPKALLVEKRRMEASARMTCRFLGLKAGDTALLCLPLDYIAGKMMVVRALTCGLHLYDTEPCSHPLSTIHLSTINYPLDFAAMVPLQVWNSLQVPEERKRLMAVRHLIIGGGAIDEALARELKSFPNAVWSTYGMTETLSHIAMRRLSGPEATEWYTPMEGVNVSLDTDGCLIVDAPAVCPNRLVTNDIADLQLPLSPGRPRFRILGRRDNVICSGGVKIQIEEAEQLLHPHISVPFCIAKCHDARLGEAVVLLAETDDARQLKPLCEQVLPRLWKPRHYVSIAHIPMTATGKTARGEVQKLLESMDF